MNSYIKVMLSSKNEFRCRGSFDLFGVSLAGFDVKLDTGCPRTSVPLLRTGLSREEIDKHMIADYRDDSIEKAVSFGVNDDLEKRKKDRELFRQG